MKTKNNKNPNVRLDDLLNELEMEIKYLQETLDYVLEGNTLSFEERHAHKLEQEGILYRLDCYKKNRDKRCKVVSAALDKLLGEE